MPETKITIELLTAAAEGDRRAQHTLYKYCFKLLMPVCFRYAKNEEFAREELSQAFVKIVFGLAIMNIFLLKLVSFELYLSVYIKIID